MIDPRPYARHPALRGDFVVFVSAGDLWRLDLGDTVPRRLTDMGGTVVRPHVSPDGSLVAFVGRHDGVPAMHVMSAEGGEAHRVVHHPAGCEPACFSPDGQRVFFVSSLASTTSRSLQVFSVSVDGGDVRKEKYGSATALAFSETGKHVALSRGYQDPATWKRYAGGLAGTLWAGSDEPFELKCVSEGPRGECQPAFWGERIVYVSDRDGTANLWSCELDGSDRRQHTTHEEYYVRWPSVDGGRVVYQHHADLRMLDLESGTDERIDIDMAADVNSTRRRFVEARRFLEAASPSPDGKSILATVRGRVAVLPAHRGPVRTLGERDGVRHGHATWMPDGKGVVLAHDASGEEELEVRPVDRDDEPTKLGRAGEGRLRLLSPSPDGRWLAVSEQASGLSIIDLETAERRHLDRATSGAITSVSWSPDGKWLAHSRPRHYRGSIFLTEVETGVVHRITSEEFDDQQPVFDPAGRYLYFLSRRVYNPYLDELAHDVGFPATTKPYAAVLSADRPSPFAPLPASDLGLDGGKGADAWGRRDEPPASDEDEADADAAETSRTDDDADDTEEKRDGSKKLEPVRVDLEGLGERIVELPVGEGRYAGLFATANKVFFLRRPVSGMAAPSGGRGEGRRLAKLIAFDLNSREEQLYCQGVRSATLSADGGTILVRGESGLRLIPTKNPPQKTVVAAGKAGEKTGVVDLSRLRVRVEPRSEWRQIFREAWRQQRGHFWTSTMSSVDWDAMYERYEPLVHRVRSREELSDLLWDLQGELGTSHAYVLGGDEPPRPNYRVGLLGCDFELDRATNRYRISAIHGGDTWSRGAHSPLAAPGMNISPGDYLLAVDGREVASDAHPWMVMERPGPAVTLTVAKQADGSDAREVVVAPVADEHRCRYREWVRANREFVAEQTEGRVGYVHVPDMQVQGLVEFHRGFLWQSDKQGLIVDVRDNGGGNVSQILLEKLRRELIGYCKARWAELEPLPDHTMTGPMVALCNERTGSDGDIFCQSWKQLGLGPLIGKRTWGGVVGIDRSKTLMDGGAITQPEYAFWFRDQGWDVEGHGVDPDIEVDITPMDHAEARDPQLEKAVEVVLQRVDAAGPTEPELPPPPDRSRT